MCRKMVCRNFHLHRETAIETNVKGKNYADIRYSLTLVNSLDPTHITSTSSNRNTPNSNLCVLLFNILYLNALFRLINRHDTMYGSNGILCSMFLAFIHLKDLVVISLMSCYRLRDVIVINSVKKI